MQVKLRTLDVAPLRENLIAEVLRYGTRVVEKSQFYLHTHVLIHEWSEPYLPIPPQPKLVLVHRPGTMEG